MNCQWDVVDGPMNGIDAGWYHDFLILIDVDYILGVGAYQLYRNATGKWCSPATNQSLPTDVQLAACSTGIKLNNFLYDLFWDKGDCVYTMEYAGEQPGGFNNYTVTHCDSTISTTSAVPVVTLSITAATSPSAPPTTATSTTSTSTSFSSSHSNTASIVGGVVGGVAGLALILSTGFVCWRKRHQHQPAPIIDMDDGVAAMSIVTPYPYPSQGISSDGVPHSNVSASDPSQSISGVVRSGSPTEPARHEDLGPIPSLHRSDSGRLPPAYNPDWEGLRGLPIRPLPEPMTTDATSGPPGASQRKLK
ncbi:hypothetical protein JVU11DRAFT_7201 [Chiua virens]|nr:hypothetical protein JVU11DRAFT_7201 [Chiua virens]